MLQDVEDEELMSDEHLLASHCQCSVVLVKHPSTLPNGCELVKTEQLPFRLWHKETYSALCGDEGHVVTDVAIA